MSSIKEQYQIGKIMKLIDLNGDATNFDMSFQVVAENDAEFDIVIVDQATLDEGKLDYKRVKGAINGNIRNDKNIYQNYMMALKADKDCSVSVETNFNRLPDNIPQPGAVPDPSVVPEPPVLEEKTGGIPWKYIIIGIIVLVGLGLMYYFYMYGQKIDIVDTFNPNATNSALPETVAPVPVMDTDSSEIFAKLRNLPLR